MPKPEYRAASKSGGQKDDPFFESDVVFTTIDQLLSSYLLMPLSLCRFWS